MPKTALYNMDGSAIGEVELSEAIFAAPVNVAAMHLVVRSYLAAQRQGTQSAKTRGEVRGGGRKIYRQKGTGNARHHGNRAPQFRHGGVVFAPKPRDYVINVPKKVRRLAFKSAMTSRLNDGDIISIDTGATVNGWVGDNAWTFYVGNPSDEVKGLCEVTRDCLKAGIAQAKPGNHLGDIGFAVQSLAERNGYGVVREYVGHGVGRVMHEDPNVPNYGKKGRGVKLQVGMIIAIEPMITLGTYRNHVLQNGWTVVTDDGLPAAHYENTIAITADGPVILTADEQGPWCPMQGGEK